MKQELTKENLPEFRQYFGHLHDALIIRFGLEIGHSPDDDTFHIALKCRYHKDNQVIQIALLELEVESVSKFHIQRKPNTAMGVIFQQNIGFFDNQIYIDFLAWSDDEDKIETFEDSHFLVVGKTCSWKVQVIEKD